MIGVRVAEICGPDKKNLNKNEKRRLEIKGKSLERKIQKYESTIQFLNNRSL